MTGTGAPTLAAGVQRWSGPDLYGQVRAAATALTAAGLRPGDRTVLAGPNSPTFVRTLLALIALDTSVVLVDHELPAVEAHRLGKAAGARWFVYDQTDPSAGGADHFGGVGPTWLPAPETATAPPDRRPLSLTAWCRRLDAAVLWSSGTTGPSKAIVKSGPSIRVNTTATATVMGYRGDDVLVPLLPMSHQYGLSLVLLWWFAGCTLVVTPYQRLTSALTEAVHNGATVVDAAPATYHALLTVLGRRPELQPSLTRVRMWCVGGAPLPSPLARHFQQTLGRPLLDGYGMTEAGNISLATPDSSVGCGRPLPGVAVQIRDDHGEPVAAGATGEIVVRSEGLCQGHLGPTGELVPAPRDGWYRTRDLGYLDLAGNLHVVGRRWAVHRNGYTLYPESLERRAEECGRPVKILATKDERRGSTLTFVVADEDGHDPRYWRRRLSQLLARYEQPNRVRVVPAFPRNRRGKVDEERLRRLLADEQVVS